MAISRRLEARGFTESQAEGVAEELVVIVENSDLVTKDFLRAEMGELRTEMAGLETKLMARSAELETKLTAQMGELKTELMGKISDVRVEVGHLKNDTIKWLISLQFGSLALTVGLIYFLLNYFLLKR